MNLNANTPVVTASPRQRQQWAQRWKELEPHVRFYLGTGDNGTMYQHLRAVHSDRIEHLHAMGFTMAEIRRTGLDDPRMPDYRFNARSLGYIATRKEPHASRRRNRKQPPTRGK